jgi:hypothetical protein
MTAPASAKLLPISFISQGNIGDKLRVYGYLTQSEDATSTIALLHSPRTKQSSPTRGTTEPGNSKSKTVKPKGTGILVDVSLCLSDETDLLRESGHLVMIVGTLESIKVCTSHKAVKSSSGIARMILFRTSSTLVNGYFESV